MASFPTNEILRTPAKGATDANPFASTSPLDNTGPAGPKPTGATTRAASGKARFQYVLYDGDTPTDTSWTNYIVKLDATVTQLEGPVFGIIGEPVSAAPKGKKKQSQREGYYVREIYRDSIGSEAFVVQRDNIECVSMNRHQAQLDNLLFRPGRKVNYDGKLEYCQIVDIDTNTIGELDGLIAINRGEDPTEENQYHVDVEDFKVCTMLEYMTNYGAGESKPKWKKVNQTGSLLSENLMTPTDLKQYQGKSKVNFVISCDMGQELTYLSELGEPKQISPEEYLNEEIFDTPEATPEEVKVKPIMKKKKASEPKITVKVKKEKVKKVLFTEEETNSESEDEDEPAENAPSTVVDEIDDFTFQTPEPKTASVSNKYGIVVTELRRGRHLAVMNSTYQEGKWKLMTIEAKADKMYRMESHRGRYGNNRTVFQIWFFGNIGEDPIAYFMPYEKVPLSEVQGIPNGKWTTSVEPVKWIRSMKQLSECLNVVSEIAHEYYRYDVFMAVKAIAKKAHLLSDLDLHMAGVNAYRDLYERALSAIVDAAVDGFTGGNLLEVALGQVHPTSKAYSDIISDRLQRVNAGSQWGKAQNSGEEEPSPEVERSVMEKEERVIKVKRVTSPRECRKPRKNWYRSSTDERYAWPLCPHAIVSVRTVSTSTTPRQRFRRDSETTFENGLEL